MKIAIGCDDAGLPLLDVLRDHLAAHADIEVLDFGVRASDDKTMYPDVAQTVAEQVAAGNAERAILVCGTGIGMAITANKVPGVRAAQAHDTYSAERARKSNDAQVITLGARVIGPEVAKQIIDVWLASEYDGGRSAPKVERMNAIDAQYRGARTEAGE